MTELVSEPVPVEVSQEDELTVRIKNMNEMLDTMTKNLKFLTSEFKIVQKEMNKLKTKKRTKKVVDPNAPKRENALEKPVVITNELCEFLGLAVGEKHSRQTVTKTINKYVKDHDLQNPENRRFILLESDEGLKLKKLLRDPDQPLTFFNIQRYLKPHYVKDEDDKTDKTDKTDKKIEDDAVVKSEPEAEPEVKVAKKKVVRRVVRPNQSES